MRNLLILTASFCFAWAAPLLHAQDPSEDCQSATPIAGTGSFPHLLGGATWDPSQLTGCHAFSDLVGYWEWTASMAGDYQLLFPLGPDTRVSIHPQGDCTLNTEILCGYGSGFQLLNVAAGQSFLLKLSYGFPPHASGSPGLLVIERAICGPGVTADDGFEENDSVGTAVPLNPGEYPGLFVRQTDPDFYSVTIPAQEQLVVRVDRDQPSMKLSVWDMAGQPLDSIYATQLVYFPDSLTAETVVVGVEPLDFPESTPCRLYDLTVETRYPVQSLSTFCDPAQPNSTSQPTRLRGLAQSQNPYIAHEWGDAHLTADDGPPGQFGYLIMGSTRLLPGSPMGAQPICVTGIVGRYNQFGTRLSSLGRFDDHGRWWSLENPAGPDGNLAQRGYSIPNQLPFAQAFIQPGESWSFQLWHREPSGGSSTSNGVTFQY